MNTVFTRPPLYIRLRSRIHAWWLRWVIESFEREAEELMGYLEAIPKQLDDVLDKTNAKRKALKQMESQS